MKNGIKKIGKTIAVTLVLTAILGAFSVLPAAATVVSIPDASATPGSTTALVPINITGVTGLCGADNWLNYDKSVVTVESVSNGNLGSITYSIDNTTGVTKMNWDSATGMTGDFVFASVTLKAVGSPGDTSALDLDVKELYDCDLVDITHTVEDGTFTIFPEVPEFNSFGLLALVGILSVVLAAIVLRRKE